MAETHVSDERVTVSLDGTETAELRQILLTHLPRFLNLFIMKNKEYGDNAQNLGPRGQFADIWRKIGKLKTALWDDKEESLLTEGADEILLDLIGHCFLTLRLRHDDRASEDPVKPFLEGDFTPEALAFLKNVSKGTGVARVTIVDIEEAFAREYPRSN